MAELKKFQSSLEEAAADLSSLCEIIDNENGELNHAIEAVFSEGKLDLAASVFRRICFFDVCAERLQTYKRVQAEIRAAQKRLEDIVERVETMTISIMEAYPSVPYKSDIGVMRVQQNAQPKLVIDSRIKLDTASVSNILDAADIKRFEISEDLYEARTYYVLLIDTVKNCLKEDREIPWATLTTGRHLRIRR